MEDFRPIFRLPPVLHNVVEPFRLLLGNGKDIEGCGLETPAGPGLPLLTERGQMMS